MREREKIGMREGEGGNSGGSCPGGRNGESILDEGKGHTRVRRKRKRGMMMKRRRKRR